MCGCPYDDFVICKDSSDCLSYDILMRNLCQVVNKFVAYGLCAVVGFYYLLSFVELSLVFSPGYALCSSYLKFSIRVRTLQFERFPVSRLFWFHDNTYSLKFSVVTCIDTLVYYSVIFFLFLVHTHDDICPF